MDAIDAGLVAVVTILVQKVVKPIPAIKARRWLIAPVAILLGIVAIYVRAGFPADAGLVWGGLCAGLASCGLFSAGKETVGAVRDAAEKRRDTPT